MARKNKDITPDTQEHGAQELEVLGAMSEEARVELAQASAFAARYGTAYELTGQIKAFGFTRKIADVSALMLVRQMKESKLYKGMLVSVEENGSSKTLTVGSFEEYCELCLGLSVSKVKEDLQIRISSSAHSALWDKLSSVFRDTQRSAVQNGIETGCR